MSYYTIIKILNIIGPILGIFYTFTQYRILNEELKMYEKDSLEYKEVAKKMKTFKICGVFFAFYVFSHMIPVFIHILGEV
jgi:hypothetical protein